MPSWCIPNNSIIIVHDWIPLYGLKQGYFLKYFYSSMRCILICLSWMLTRKTFNVVCISEATQSDTLRLLRYSRRKHLISYGYQDTLTPVVLSYPRFVDYNYSLERSRILLFADYQPHKNLKLTLQALRVLKAQPANGITVTIIAKSKALRQRVLEVCPYADVYLLPSDAQLALLMRESRYILYLSTVEGFGLPVFEAFHHGSIPVVYPSKVNTEILGLDYPYYADTVDRALSIIKCPPNLQLYYLYANKTSNRVNSNSLNSRLNSLLSLW